MSDFPANIVEWVILIVVVSIIWGVITFIAYISSNIITSFREIGLLIITIPILILIPLLIIGDYQRSKSEDVILKKTLKQKSIELDMDIISQIAVLYPISREIFCKLYGLSDTSYEYIATFIAENFNEYQQNRMKLILKNKSLHTIFDGNKEEKEEYIYILKDLFPKSLIEKVLIRDDYTCQKCGETLLETIGWGGEIVYYDKTDLYHLNTTLKKSLCDGGTITEDNLISICYDCYDKLPYIEQIEKSYLE